MAALRGGADDCLPTPVDADTLRATLARVLRRRQLVTEIRQSEARLASILDTAVDGIVTIDQRGIVQSVNAAAARMFGYAEREIVGQNVKLLMPPSDRDQHDAYIQNYLKTGEKRIIGIGREVVGRRKDGSEFAMDLAVSEVRLGDRRLFTGMVRDISERRRAEAELRRLKTAIDVLAEGVMITDAHLDPPGPRILFVNPAMTRITGYTADELLGRTPRVLQGPYTNRAELDKLRQLLQQGQTYVGQNVNFRKDRSPYDVELQISPVRDDAGNIVNFVSTHRDISQQKQAEQRARQAERLAAIGQTVTGLAHESRNAFQRSQACLEMLAMELEDRPEALELVERTQKALDDLHHLYEEVRDYAAPIVLDRQVCDLAHVWRDSWSHLRQAHGEKGVHLIERADGVDLACQVDWFAMGQVFRNVLENAIAACPVGGRIVVHCREVRLLGQYAIEVAIRDDGPGFDPANRGKVFDPFFTTKVKGTGLGMAIARRIVEAHGGRIALGDAGPGAEVILTLPRA
jgi:PAS domain S-box-containing protein